MQSEQVLCIPTTRLTELGSFQGANPDISRYIPALFAAPSPTFVDRDLCEEDPSLKQLIPYLLVEWQGRIFRYFRGKKGGESRLHAKASIGIGGHVNQEEDGVCPEQGTPLQASTHAEAIFLRGLQRELEEELHFNEAPTSITPLGLINDDSNPVGEVHLGIAYLASFADSAQLQEKEDSLVNAGFCSITELEAEAELLESWSQLALQLYKNNAANTN